MMRQALALVLAGGRGSRLAELTDWRAKPAVSFGGKFRIVDFALSNCVNSGIRRIGVCTHPRARVDRGQVVLPHAEIGAGAVIRRAVIDKCCRIPAGMTIGVDPEQDRRRFRVTERGVTLGHAGNARPSRSAVDLSIRSDAGVMLAQHCRKQPP